MAVTVLKNISQDEINWYHETRYWMHISDEKSMISSAEDRGIAKGIQQKAIEAAVKLVQKYKAKPEEAAADMGAPLDKVIEALSAR